MWFNVVQRGCIFELFQHWLYSSEHDVIIRYQSWHGRKNKRPEKEQQSDQWREIIETILAWRNEKARMICFQQHLSYSHTRRKKKQEEKRKKKPFSWSSSDVRGRKENVLWVLGLLAHPSAVALRSRLK